MVAVRGLDLDLAPGEVFGLLGPNGAGKTSALSAVEGPLRPDAGTVTIAGIDAVREPARARAHIDGQLQATSFSPELRLVEIVQLFAGLHGLRLGSDDVVRRLGAMDLAGKARRAFRQRSGGQQQRLSLLVATVHQPTLLLLDEVAVGRAHLRAGPPTQTPVVGPYRRSRWQRRDRAADHPLDGGGGGGVRSGNPVTSLAACIAYTAAFTVIGVRWFRWTRP